MADEEQLDTVYQLPGDYPGLRETGNLDLNRRPRVQNPDGTVSTELSTSIGTDKGEVLIPTVVNGKVVPQKEAIAHYNETGEHLGVFDTPENATRYAKDVHNRPEVVKLQPPKEGVPASIAPYTEPTPTSVLPAADATAVAPTPWLNESPPSWKEVAASPEYQALDPQKQLVTFDRWHKQAYNWGSAQPDWEGEVETVFNQKAYETQNALQKRAGMSPDEARYNLAKTAIASGRKEDELPADLRETLANPPPDTGFVHQLFNMGRVAGAQVGATVFNALGGLAGMAAEEAGKPSGNFITDPAGNWSTFMRDHNIFGLKKEEIADALNGAAEYWNGRAKSAAEESQVDPKLEDTWQAKAAHGIAGVAQVLGEGAIPEVGIPLLLSHNALKRYGEVMDQTGDPSKAEVAKNASLVGDGLFIGLGSGMIQGLEKVIPKGMPALKSWAVKTSAITGGNVGVGQLVKAGTAAAEAEPGERMSAFTHAISEVTPADALNAAAFALVSTLPQKGRVTEPEAQPDPNAAKVGPATAAADAEAAALLSEKPVAGKIVEPTDTKASVEPELNVDYIDGKLTGTVNIPEGTSPEQLAKLHQQVTEANLPGEVKNQLLGEINTKVSALVSPPEAQTVAERTAAALEGTSTEGEGGGGPDTLTPREQDIAALNKPKPLKGFEELKLTPEGEMVRKKLLEDKAEEGGFDSVEEYAKANPDEYAAYQKIFTDKYSLPQTERYTGKDKAIRAVVAPEGEKLAPAPPSRPIPIPEDAPTPEEVKAQQTFEKRPPRSQEEIDAGVERLRRKAVRQGSVSRADVWAEVGQQASSPVLEKIRGELAEAFPVQTEPPPTTKAEGDVKHPVVEVGGKRVKLPLINEKGVVRPMFTNDPATTALQIDVNGIEDRIYINKKLVDNDQINPAIDYAFEKMPDGTTRAYVTGVESKYGKIEQPGDYTEAYKTDPEVEARRLAQTKGKEFQLTPETDEFQARLQRLREKRDLTEDETTRLEKFNKYAEGRLSHLDEIARERVLQAVKDKAEEQVRRFGADKGLKAPLKIVRGMEATYTANVKGTTSLEALAEKGIEPSQEGTLKSTEAAREGEEVVDTGHKTSDALADELASRGVDLDAVAELGDDAIDFGLDRKGKTKLTQRSENLNLLDRAGLLPRKGDNITNRAAHALERIAAMKDMPNNLRILAKRLLRTKLDFSKVKIELFRDEPDSPLGQYRWDSKTGDNPRLRLNADAEHIGEGKAVQTFLHELSHHATVMKLDPTYSRNPTEERAYQGLKKAYEKATREIFKLEIGREPTNEEAELFKRAQLAGDETAANELAKATDKLSWDLAKDDYYGLSRIQEFVSEAMSNGRFQEMLSRIAADKPEGRIANLLQQIRQFFKELLLGEKVGAGSLLDKTFDDIFTLAKTAPEKGRIGKVSPEEAAKPKPFISRTELEKQAKEYGMPDWKAQSSSETELRKFVEDMDKRSAIAEGDLSSTPSYSSDEPASGSGWIGPAGEKIEAPVDIGAHAQTLMEHLQATDPNKAKELEKFVTNKRGDDAAPLAIEDVYDWAAKKGFVHIHDDGRNVYFAGRPSPSQVEQLVKSAIKLGKGLIQDLGGKREKVVVEALNAQKPQGQGPTVRLATTLKGGKMTHQLRIEPNATTQDLLDFQDQINKAPHLTAAEKLEFNAQIAEKTGPVLSYWTGRDQVIAGSSRLENESNKIGRQAANRVALLFDRGSMNKKGQTEAQLQDQAAMPFIVESGGKMSELLVDLDRVSNSKTPEEAKPFIALVQYAIDNFDRLNKLRPAYNEIMKERVVRENDHGLDVGELEDYVSRPMLKNMLEEEGGITSLFTGKGGNAGNRYFIKGRFFDKLSDAIAEGFIPQSKGKANPTDIVALTQRRVEAGERLVQRAILTNQFRGMRAADGKAIVSKPEKYTTTTGELASRNPHGYQTVLTGGQPLVVHNQYAPLFKALYGDSSPGAAVSVLMKAVGSLKRNTLMLDTFHVGRMMFKELGYSKGANRFGWNKGLSILEYRDADLDAAVKAGDISQRMADYAREKVKVKTADGIKEMSRRDISDLLINHGLNVGRVADNLWAEHTVVIPGIKNFNPWVFQKLSRGAMLQTAIENFIRNNARFTERGLEGNARQTAKEYNEVFGNLQKQSLFKKREYQDLLRATFLAPQWAESQLMAEGRGYAQLLKGAGELATGKARLGTVAQGQLTVIAGMLAANQIINAITRGHTTFENKEHGHQLDAYIPDFIGGGKRGFWFNPFEIGAEYAFMANRYFAEHQTPVDIIGQIASNKLSNIGRSAKDLFTGRDWSGRKHETFGDRLTGALTDLLPLPMPASGVFEKDPRQPWPGHIEKIKGVPVPLPPGYRLNRAPGATEKQILQGAGLKVHYESSPASEMYQLAHAFRKDGGHDDPSPYRDLKRALNDGSDDDAVAELKMLADRGHTYDQIRAAVGLSKSGSITPARFTGGTVEQERIFVRSLTPEQKELWNEAQKDNRENAQKLKKLLGTLRSQDADFSAKLRENTKPIRPE